MTGSFNDEKIYSEKIEKASSTEKANSTAPPESNWDKVSFYESHPFSFLSFLNAR